MKVLIEGNKERYEKYYPDMPIVNEVEKVFCVRGTSNENKLLLAKDAECLLVDAISIVDEQLINAMPNLKMIHSEGVAYNGIDVNAATKKNVYVCNNKGCNDSAVAEQAIMLMLELLRKGITGDMAVRDGKQMAMKEYSMVHGIRELGECIVGLIGFGDIGMATAKRLNAFGCKTYYYAPHRKDESIEKEYNVEYLSLEEMAGKCDIISIHCAVTDDTRNMINDEFIDGMKKDSYIINTSRGEIVDNAVLRNALIDGRVAGAGLDTIYPEPTLKTNPLVDLPEEIKYKVCLAPHLGGITTGSFKRGHANMWNDVSLIAKDKRPNNIVNEL